MDIRTLASRIKEYSQQLESGALSALERDILLADLRELYLLVKEGQTTEKEQAISPQVQTPQVEKTVSESTAPRQEPAVVKETKPVIEFIQDEPVVHSVQAPPVVEATPVAEVEMPIIKEQITEEPVQLETRRIHYHEGAPVRGPKPASLNEVFTGEERSLNTMAGGEKKRALNDRIAGTDLNSLLDLNRKHVLTSELFAGDSQAFQTAIRRINESATIEAAFEYIKTELLPKYQWKGDMQSAKLFDKLVRQKFGL